MTAPSPPLVDVIAEAIADHGQELDQTACPTGYCICNERFATDEDHAAHQARTVLDALTEAGGVEWGVQWAGEDGVTEYQPSDKATVASAMRADIAWAKRQALKTVVDGTLVSRITGPWTATG